MMPPTIAIDRSFSWIYSCAQLVLGRLAPAPVDVTSNVTSNQVICARVFTRQPLNMHLFAMVSGMGPQGALESIFCGVLLTSGSRSFWRRLRHMSVHFDYCAAGQTVEICRADFWQRPYYVVSWRLGSLAGCVPLHDFEMYISKWWVVYLSLELLLVRRLCSVPLCRHVAVMSLS
jgi:hypothetical protein